MDNQPGAERFLHATTADVVPAVLQRSALWLFGPKRLALPLEHLECQGWNLYGAGSALAHESHDAKDDGVVGLTFAARAASVAQDDLACPEPILARLQQLAPPKVLSLAVKWHAAGLLL